MAFYTYYIICMETVSKDFWNMYEWIIIKKITVASHQRAKTSTNNFNCSMGIYFHVIDQCERRRRRKKKKQASKQNLWEVERVNISCHCVLDGHDFKTFL